MNSVDNSIAILSVTSLTTYALISVSFVWDIGYREFRGRTSELPFNYVTREAKDTSSTQSTFNARRVWQNWFKREDDNMVKKKRGLWDRRISRGQIPALSFISTGDFSYLRPQLPLVRATSTRWSWGLNPWCCAKILVYWGLRLGLQPRVRALALYTQRPGFTLQQHEGEKRDGGEETQGPPTTKEQRLLIMAGNRSHIWVWIQC